MLKLMEIAPDLAIAAVAAGLLGYLVALGFATFASRREGSLGARLAGWFVAHPAQNLGIPTAAISAFAIVAVLLRHFPLESDSDGALAFKLFSMEFSGPSGPIMLWLMCFLGFVAALKILRN